MIRRHFLTTGLALAGGAMAGCSALGLGGGWTTLVDGATIKNLDGWSQVGEGNWSIVDGALQGKDG